MVSKWSQKPMTNRPQNSTKNIKNMLKNRARKSEKIIKHDPKMAPKNWRDFKGNASCRTNEQKMTKTAPRVRKWAPKVDPFRSQAKMRSKSGPFGIQARRTARSAYNRLIINNKQKIRTISIFPWTLRYPLWFAYGSLWFPCEHYGIPSKCRPPSWGTK